MLWTTLKTWFRFNLLTVRFDLLTARFNLLTVRLNLFTIRFSVFTLRFSVFTVRFSVFTESFCVLLVPYRVIGVKTETFGSLVFELRSKTNIFYACPGQIPAETGIEHHQYLQGSEVD